jgi:WD40 repeat protein
MHRRRLGRWLLAALVASAAFEAARLTLPCKPRISIPYDGDPGYLTFSADGSLLATAMDLSESQSPSFRIRVWNCVTGRRYADLSQTDTPLVSAAISADGRRVAALGKDGDCIVWDVAKGMETSHTKLKAFPVGDGWPSCVSFGPDGSLFALHTVWADNGRILWDGLTGHQLEVSEPQGVVYFHRGTIVGIENCLTESLDFFDDATGKLLSSIPFWGSNWPCVLGYVPRTGTACYVQPEGKGLAIWNITRGESCTINTESANDVPSLLSVGLSPDGKRIAIAPFLRSETHPSPFDSLPTWLPSQIVERLTAQTDSELHIYSLPDGRERLRLPGEEGIFSPDGRTLLVVNFGGRPFSSLGRLDILDIYDVPFRGPFGLAVVVALICGVLAYAAMARLFRSSKAA